MDNTKFINEGYFDVYLGMFAPYLDTLDVCENTVKCFLPRLQNDYSITNKRI